MQTWKPPDSLITIVAEESGVTRQEAFEALRQCKGNIVAALEALN